METSSSRGPPSTLLEEGAMKHVGPFEEDLSDQGTTLVLDDLVKVYFSRSGQRLRPRFIQD